MGLKFEQASHWDDGICAFGHWDLVKIWAGKWKLEPSFTIYQFFIYMVYEPACYYVTNCLLIAFLPNSLSLKTANTSTIGAKI